MTYFSQRNPIVKRRISVYNLDANKAHISRDEVLIFYSDLSHFWQLSVVLSTGFLRQMIVTNVKQNGIIATIVLAMQVDS
jgi:hypothetical protein